MAISPVDRFPGNVAPVSPEYPYGGAINDLGETPGTPWEAGVCNDMFGFQQAIMTLADLVPTGDPETATVSQYLEALSKLLLPGRKNLLYGNFLVNYKAKSGTINIASGEYGHNGFFGGSGGCQYTIDDATKTATIISGTLVQYVHGAQIVTGTYTLSWEGNCQASFAGGGFFDSGLSGAGVEGEPVIVEFGIGTLRHPQLEYGVRPTRFSARPIQYEELLCNRYMRLIGFGLNGYVSSQAGGVVTIGTSNEISMSDVGSTSISLSTTIITVKTAAGNSTSSGSTVSNETLAPRGAVFDIDGFSGLPADGTPVICVTAYCVVIEAGT